MRPARRAMSRILVAVLVILAFAALVSLGNWQLRRLEWKQALIASATERPGAPSVSPPAPAAWAGFDPAAWEYRRVALTGAFGQGEVHAWTALSEPKGALGGPGVWLVAPFITTDGWTVLVNRGFVPDGLRDPASRPAAAPPSGTVTVEGLVRRDDPPSPFTPSPDAAERLVFSRDVATLTGLLGLDPATVAPYTVDLVASETPPGGVPQAGESQLAFSNNHLQYALTWYGLAAALLGVVAAAAWSRRRDSP